MSFLPFVFDLCFDLSTLDLYELSYDRSNSDGPSNDLTRASLPWYIGAQVINTTNFWSPLSTSGATTEFLAMSGWGSFSQPCQATKMPKIIDLEPAIQYRIYGISSFCHGDVYVTSMANKRTSLQWLDPPKDKSTHCIPPPKDERTHRPPIGAIP